MKKLFVVMLSAVAIMGLVGLSFGADKLIVKDSGGTNTMFVVTDTGLVALNTGNYADSPTWSKLYSSADGAINGLTFSSYGTGAALGGGGLFRFARGTSAAKSIVQSGDRLGFFVFSGYDGAAFQNSGGLTAKIDGVASAGNVPAKLSFETGTSSANRTERVVINSVGRVGIGVAAPTHLIHLSGGAYSDGAVWTNASSRALKENIETLSSDKAIDALKNLNPVVYNYKTDGEQKHVGFIAEDVPDLVATKDRKGLSPMDIVAVLTKVVQEQSKTIEALSAKVDKLETSSK